MQFDPDGVATDVTGDVYVVDLDEESGELWCPTALPIRDELGVYVARHGWGYSRFEHEARGIDRVDRPQAHRAGGELPERRHKPRMAIRR